MNPLNTMSGALQINPNDVDALNNVGVILARQGKLDEAIKIFTVRLSSILRTLPLATI